MQKIKQFQVIALYFIVIILLTYLLFDSKILYVNSGEYYVKVGVKPKKLTFREELESVDKSILESEEAIRDADLIIEDARRRGILE